MVLEAMPTRKLANRLFAKMWQESPLEVALGSGDHACQRFLAHNLIKEFVQKRFNGMRPKVCWPNARPCHTAPCAF